MAQFCVICGNKVGLFGASARVAGGMVCGRCLKEAHIDHFPCSLDYSAESVGTFLNERKSLAAVFAPERACVTNRLRVDSRNALFMLCGNLYQYSDLVRYHRHEEKKTQTVAHDTGGSGRAVGAMIGAAALARPRVTSRGRIKTSLVGRTTGALIGGAIGSKFDRHEVTTTVVEDYLVIDVILSGSVAAEETLRFDMSDDHERRQGERCLDLLESIVQANRSNGSRPPRRAVPAAAPAVRPPVKPTPEPAPQAGPEDTAATIARYYELYKSGAITAEEYARKKGELLGIRALAGEGTPPPQPAPPLRPVAPPRPAVPPQPAPPLRPTAPSRPAAPPQPAVPQSLRMPRMTYTVSPGQKTTLGLPPDASEEIQVCVGWDTGSARAGLAVAVSALDEAGRETRPGDAVRILHTRPTEQANVAIDLGKLPPTVRKISFELRLTGGPGADPGFSALKNAWLRVLRSDGREILGFPVSQCPPDVNALVLGDVYLHREGWKFNPVGRGLKR